MKKQPLISKALGIGLLLSPGVLAEITIDGTAFWNRQESPITGTFDASGSDKLVLVLTGEHGFNNAAGQVNSVTYDGVPLEQGLVRAPVAATTDTTYQEVWYLDNPATDTGEIIVEAATRANVTAYGISGAEEGIGATAIGDPDSTTAEITTTATGSLVIASYGMGGFNNNAFIDAASPDEPLIEVSRQRNNARNWDGHVVSHAFFPTVGTKEISYTNDNPDAIPGAHVIAAEFVDAGGLPGGVDFAISAIVYREETGEVTLTFPKTGAPTFAITASEDLIDWSQSVDDNITEASDEDTDDAENITVTLPIPAGLQDNTTLFFRAEQGS